MPESPTVFLDQMRYDSIPDWCPVDIEPVVEIEVLLGALSKTLEQIQNVDAVLRAEIDDQPVEPAGVEIGWPRPKIPYPIPLHPLLSRCDKDDEAGAPLYRDPMGP